MSFDEFVKPAATHKVKVPPFDNKKGPLTGNVFAERLGWWLMKQCITVNFNENVRKPMAFIAYVAHILKYPKKPGNIGILTINREYKVFGGEPTFLLRLTHYADEFSHVYVYDMGSGQFAQAEKHSSELLKRMQEHSGWQVEVSGHGGFNEGISELSIGVNPIKLETFVDAFSYFYDGKRTSYNAMIGILDGLLK